MKESIYFLDIHQQKFKIIEDIVYIETDVVEDSYIFSGNLYFHEKETETKILLTVKFDGVELSKNLCLKYGFSFSETYGAFKYLTSNKNKQFSIEFIIPDNVKNVTFGIRKWHNKYDVYISSKLVLKQTKENSIDLVEEIHSLRKVINDTEKNNFSQIESLINLQNVLNIRFPLPKMRGWAISPDFAELLLGEILIRKPKNIVEFGSGVSTLIIGYALEMNKRGKLTSFEHDMYYGAKTIQNIKLHGLEEYAEVIHAPIGGININNRESKWYSIDKTKIPEKIDILVVDGPPARTDNEARYPALPYLMDCLANDAIVIMDDGIRQEEKDICKRWIEEYPEFESEYIETEKGTFILRRKI